MIVINVIILLPTQFLGIRIIKVRTWEKQICACLILESYAATLIREDPLNYEIGSNQCKGWKRAGPLARLILPTVCLWIRFSNFDPEY